MESVFDALCDSKACYSSNLDLKSSFWQIPLDEETRHKSAFITRSGVYEWKRLSYGLMNAAITFQCLMTQVLRGLNWKFLLVYIDEILMFSQTFEEHLDHLKQVFTRLKDFSHQSVTLLSKRKNF